MKKMFMLFLASAMLIVMVGLVGCGGNGTSNNGTNKQQTQEPTQPPAKSFEFSMQSALQDNHPAAVGAFLPWLAEIKERTGDKVVINWFNPNSLTPVKDTYDSVVGGIIDIGEAGTGIPGKFPFITIGELPFFVPNAEIGSAVFWELFETVPEIQNEFKETELLWLAASAPFQLHTNKPVKTLADLKGMTIIGWTAESIEKLRLLGANPIQVTPQETYLALQKNMADGVLAPFASVVSFKINEVMKYHTVLNMSVTPRFAAMNKEQFNSMPDEFKAVFKETAGVKMAMATGRSLDNADNKVVGMLAGQGHTLIELSPEELRKWAEKVQSLYDEWVKSVESRGRSNAVEILELARELVKKYSN